MDSRRLQFEEAKRKIIGVDRNRNGIGTLSEKTVHAVLKQFYAPNEDYHEIPIENFVADIFTGSEIIEIQTRSFNAMRRKLECFLPLYPLTIVYPIPHDKYLIWIDEQSGELSNKRKSPKRGNIYQAFSELYKIKMYLKSPNLKFCFLLMDVEEYRLLNGWSKDRKKGSDRFDRIPTEYVEEVWIERKEDYLQFLPYDLPPEFTVKEFSKNVKIPPSLGGIVMNILYELEVVERIGKNGREYLYIVKE